MCNRPKPDGSKVCRTCLMELPETNAGFSYLDSLDSTSLRHKLVSFLPEIDLHITPDAVICSSCSTAINAAYQFREQCLRTEHNILSFFEDIRYSTDIIDLLDVVRYNKKEDHHVKVEFEAPGIRNEKLQDSSSQIIDLTDDADSKMDDIKNQSKIAEFIKEELDLYICEPIKELEAQETNNFKEEEKHLLNLKMVDMDLEEINTYLTDGSYNEYVTIIEENSNKYETDMNYYRCNDCDFITAYKYRLVNHVKVHEKATQDNLYVDDANTKREKANQVSNVKEDCYICDTCGFSTTQKFCIIDHVKSHRELKRYKCAHCHYSSNKKYTLDKHTEIHSSRETYKCNVCQFKTVNKKYLSVHSRVHTEEKSFKCPNCEYSCRTKQLLQRHMKSHFSKELFKCFICAYETVYRGNLNQHMKSHTGEKPYKCQMCDFRSRTRQVADIHMRNHTGAKPFKCKYCDYCTKQSTHLRIHMLNHTGEKPYKCAECNYASTQSNHLKTHMRKHTGEKPYACHLCDYRARLKESLKCHIRTHTGEKPYKCTECSYSCTQGTALRIHKTIHEKGTFECYVCGYKTPSKRILVTHMKTH